MNVQVMWPFFLHRRYRYSSLASVASRCSLRSLLHEQCYVLHHWCLCTTVVVLYYSCGVLGVYYVLCCPFSVSCYLRDWAWLIVSDEKLQLGVCSVLPDRALNWKHCYRWISKWTCSKREIHMQYFSCELHMFRRGLEHLPHKRKIGCSNPSRDRPKLRKQVVTAPLPKARH